MMPPKRFRLTSTNGTRGDRTVDATTKKLIEKLRQLEIEGGRIAQQRRAITTALNIAGVRPGKYLEYVDSKDSDYARTRSFANKPLTESCEQILRDFKGEWLSKSQIEYLVVRGGYEFSAKDTKNSVDVTLRRLAEEGKIDVTRVRGSRGNKYRSMTEEIRKDNGAESDRVSKA